jgi:hypothetical protein
MSGLSDSSTLSDGNGLYRDRDGLWSGSPGLINRDGGPVDGSLLQENGFFLLQEDGSYILLG